jgi:hypothetical protein
MVCSGETLRKGEYQENGDPAKSFSLQGFSRV